MKQVVSFDKLKLTNNQLDENGHVSLSQISDGLSAMIESSSFLLRDAAEPQEMLLRCKQSLILGDLKLNAQIPAQAPRDLHHPSRGG